MPKKEWSHPDTLPYNPEIAKRIRELSAAGVPVKDIHKDIQRYQSAPGSYSTLYKYYSNDLHAAKIETSRRIGDRVATQAIEGDIKDPSTFKSQELWLRTQGGWTPKESVETREAGTDEEEADSAISALMKALGKGTDEE